MKGFPDTGENSVERRTVNHWPRWAMAVLAVALTLVVRWLLWPALQEQAPLLLFTLAVVAGAWYGGLGPGLLATFLSALVGKFFFIAPYHELGFSDPRDGVRLGLFVLIGVAISYLSQTLLSTSRRAEASAEESRKHQAASRQSEERFRLLVEGVRDYAIFLMDTEGHITSWNFGAERLLGYKEREVIGHKLHRIFTPEDVASGKPELELRTALETGRADDKRWHVRKDGSRFWADGVVTAIRDEAGNLRGLSKLMRDNTALRQAEEELRKSEGRFRGMADTLPAMVWLTDPEARCIYINRRWLDFTGRTLEQELGFGWLESVHPDDREQSGRVFLAANEKHEPFSLEYRLRRHDGEYRWAIDSGLPRLSVAGEFQGFIGSVIDITERKQNEQSIIRKSRQATMGADVGTAFAEGGDLPDILQDCAEAIVKHLDAAFVRIWLLNKAENVLELRASAGLYTHLNGPHSRVPVGQFKIGLIAEERQPHLTNEVIGDPRVSDQEWARREGMIAFAGYPLVVEERLVGVMALFAREPLAADTLDALAAVANMIAQGTERKLTEAERDQVLLREQAARGQAEQANRLKDEFLATVSHELRTPLTAILGWSRMLQDNRIDAGVMKSALATIERNAQAQQQLIEDLMDVSRIITGKLRLNVRPVELVTVINAALEAVRPAAEAKAIRLQPVLDPVASAVSGDPDRLQQVVWNLLSNAIKFTPKGGRVQVRLERVNSHVEIAVSDTGQGISAEFLPYVFERFRQADSSTTRKHGGLGLGLAIVRQLVEMHGGTAGVASDGEGQGATFKVKLPLMIVHRDAGDEERRHPQADEGTIIECPPELDGVRVLVVDDEPDARQLLAAVLERCGAEVSLASSAAEALRLLEAARPDVLLSDIGMPGEDGYSLIRKVRALPAEQGGRTPAAALTAYAGTEDRKRALLAGFQLHIPKPVEPTELITVVASLAGRVGVESK